MDRQDAALTLISFSVIIGLAMGIFLNEGGVNTEFLDGEEVHEHALFFVYANGSEIDLSDERFQLKDDEVHLENGRSHIVHKHADGVTWGDFLDTVNISVNSSGSSDCLKMPNASYCGNMTVMLNGDDFNPDKEIEQSDNLAIVLGENSNETASSYMELDLPEAYIKRVPGTRV